MDKEYTRNYDYKFEVLTEPDLSRISQRLWDMNTSHRDWIKDWSHDEIAAWVDEMVDEYLYQYDLGQTILYFTSQLSYFNYETTYYGLWKLEKEFIKRVKNNTNIKDE